MSLLTNHTFTYQSDLTRIVPSYNFNNLQSCILIIVKLIDRLDEALLIKPAHFPGRAVDESSAIFWSRFLDR